MALNAVSQCAPSSEPARQPNLACTIHLRRVVSLLAVASASICPLLSRPSAQGQVTNDAIALWTFDEGSGTTALDSSGNNHSGTILGATYVAGRSNTALSFNGSNNFVFTSDAASGGTAGAGLDMGPRDWTGGENGHRPVF